MAGGSRGAALVEETMNMDDPKPQKPKKQRPPFLAQASGVALKVLSWILAFGIAAIVLLVILLPCFYPAVVSSNRITCCNNLKQIALAVHNYAETNRCFPPAYIADKNGKPMHSWRVLISALFGTGCFIQGVRFF